jgi:membrane protein implicated in regulation of membrane protease activity
VWWEFTIYIALAVAALYLVIFQQAFVRKYWKVLGAILILVVVIVFIIARIVSGRRNTTETGTDLQGAVTTVREEIEDANREAAVRIAAARAKDQAKIDELKKVLAMKDRVARRKRLAQLAG